MLWTTHSNSNLVVVEVQRSTVSIHYKNIVGLPKRETSVPYKILSFDIEASSSHGDFPLAKKNYFKLASNIVDYIIKQDIVNVPP